MKSDFGATATDYAEHRAGFPDSLFDRLAKLGLGGPGQDMLDLRTGTGSLGRGFARRGCNVIGLDLAGPLLAKAQELDAREGIHSDSYDLEVPYTPEAWRGRIRASAGVGGTLSAAAVEQFDAELATILARRCPGSVLQIPHRVFAVIAQPAPGAAHAVL